MKKLIKSIPIVGTIVRFIYRKWINTTQPFSDSTNYWINRYNSGGNSGDGSYNNFAKFKAEIINAFVAENKTIKTVIEYGCGDGNQLRLAKYPSYIGFDVSPKAVEICKKTFLNDSTKKFKLMENYSDEIGDLILSLDVIYHLVEDSVFEAYMTRLFESSKKFVIIYSSNTDKKRENQAPHVRHRKFTKWIENNKPQWQLSKHVPNIYFNNSDTKTGHSLDFFIYQKN